MTTEHREVSKSVESGTGVSTVSRRRLLQLMGSGGAALTLGRVATAESSSRPTGSPPSQSLPETPLTRDYDIVHPFVGAGMGFVALPELVAAVSNAGGLGVLGAAPEPPPAVAERIDQIRALTDRPFGVDFFLAESPTLGPVTVEAHIDVAIASRVPLVVFHFATPPVEWIDALKSAGSNVWAQVPSLRDAEEALTAGVDGLVVQGREAGGHSKSRTPLSKLLRDFRRALGDDILLLAAGGIATGHDVARALRRGADGVWVGTRLIASSEAHAREDWKLRLVTAKKDETVITKLFGPELPCLPFRVLRTSLVNELIDREEELCALPPEGPPIGSTTLFPGTSLETPDVPMPRLSALLATPETVGDLEQMPLAAGTGVERIHDIKPAAQIVEEMMATAGLILAASSG